MNEANRRTVGRALGLATITLALLTGLAMWSPGEVSAAGTCSTSPHMPPPKGAANPVRTGNPLDDGPWAGSGRAEPIVAAYCSAKYTAGQRALFGHIALQPKMTFFDQSFTPAAVTGRIRQYISLNQHGNPHVIVHLSVFGLWPQGESAQRTPLTRTQQGTYIRWINHISAGIGSSRVAIALEPDLAITQKLTRANRTTRLALARYAAKRFHDSNPHASVYLDASSQDWMGVWTRGTYRAAKMLKQAGVAYARGFVLGATHYTRTGPEIDWGTSLASTLAHDFGIRGRHFVIDTADNGRGFTMKWYLRWLDDHPRYQATNDFDNAWACPSAATPRCDTLGIPPMWRVTRTRSITDAQQAEAAKHVDGYVWIGRPWRKEQAGTFLPDRALQVARTAPFQ